MAGNDAESQGVPGNDSTRMLGDAAMILRDPSALYFLVHQVPPQARMPVPGSPEMEVDGGLNIPDQSMNAGTGDPGHRNAEASTPIWKHARAAPHSHQHLPSLNGDSRTGLP